MKRRNADEPRRHQRINIQYARVEPIASDQSIRQWVRLALGHQPFEITVRFVGSREAGGLNALYRQRAYATNILTFTLEQKPIAADLVVCTPIVRREALAQGKPLAHHLAHLVIHGCLHAAGHDHERANDAKRMEALERQLLGQLGLPDPYLLRPEARPARAVLFS